MKYKWQVYKLCDIYNNAIDNFILKGKARFRKENLRFNSKVWRQRTEEICCGKDSGGLVTNELLINIRPLGMNIQREVIKRKVVHEKTLPFNIW